MNEDTLDGWREKVDALDSEIVRLLIERAAAARHIGEAKRKRKAPIQDPDREDRVLRRVNALNDGRLDSAALEAVYRQIFAMCIQMQKETQT